MFNTAIGVAFSAAFVWLLLGTLCRTYVWLSAASGLPIALTPAPKTRTGVAFRLLLEVLLFRSLFRASPITWVASLAFHYGLLLVLLMHLRFIFPILPTALLSFISISLWSTTLTLAGLFILLLRRMVIDRIRYISSPSDYLLLILLILIAVSGLLLKRLWPTDLHQVGLFLRGTLTLNWQALPASIALYSHLLLVLLLLFIFPISKLLHGLGVLFAPTFNQRDRGDAP